MTVRLIPDGYVPEYLIESLRLELSTIDSMLCVIAPAYWHGVADVRIYLHASGAHLFAEDNSDLEISNDDVELVEKIKLFIGSKNENV